MLVNITIPVFNEEAQLPGSVRRLEAFVSRHCQFKFEIVVANNASTDRTQRIAEELTTELPAVRVVFLGQQGRGGAVKKVWSASTADILSYMDCDLSTDLEAFPRLIDALAGGGYDLATGSRLLDPSLTTRSFKREFISRSYNLLIKALFHCSFSDAQCGCKAITRTAATALLPIVRDDGWFMDTELLLVAEKLGYRLFDLPVRWVDDADSRVNITSTIIGDLRGLIRVRRSFARAGWLANSAPGAQHGRARPEVPEVRVGTGGGSPGRKG